MEGGTGIYIECRTKRLGNWNIQLRAEPSVKSTKTADAVISFNSSNYIGGGSGGGQSRQRSKADNQPSQINQSGRRQPVPAGVSARKNAG